MTIFKSVFPFFGYHLIFSIIYLDYVRPEAVCLGEDLVMRWDLSLNSDIAFANIKHNANLIVIIDTPNHMIIEESFKNRVRINVTENWLVEMTMFNVTYATKGTYKCTIGFIGKTDLIIKKEIFVIDPEINILLDTSDNECKYVKCASKYHVTLIGPNRRKGKENICLSEYDSGIYSCCLSDKYICPSKRCKSIDVRIKDNTNKFHRGTFEYTTKEISLSTQVNQQNTFIIIYCTIPVIVIVLCILLCILFRKELRDIIRKGTRRCENQIKGSSVRYNTIQKTTPSSFLDGTKSTSWEENSEHAEMSWSVKMLKLKQELIQAISKRNHPTKKDDTEVEIDSTKETYGVEPKNRKDMPSKLYKMKCMIEAEIKDTIRREDELRRRKFETKIS